MPLCRSFNTLYLGKQPFSNTGLLEISILVSRVIIHCQISILYIFNTLDIDPNKTHLEHDRNKELKFILKETKINMI